MYTKEIIKTEKRYMIKIFKDNNLFITQEFIMTNKGLQYIPNEQIANQLGTEMIEYYNRIDKQ